MRKLVLLTALCMVASAPALAQSKATIEKLNAKWADAFNKGDAAAVAQLYATDAVVLPPGAEMAKGRDGIRAFWQGAAQQLGDIRFSTAEVTPLGQGWAREIGTFAAKTKPDAQPVAGKYVVLWHKVGKDWKLATDIWNASK
jgi:uncharacterized protein (TIGR02246 family)